MQKIMIWVLLTVCGMAMAAELAVKSGDKIVFTGDNVVFFGKYYPSGFINMIDKAFKTNGLNVSIMALGKGGNKSNQMLEKMDQEVLLAKPNWLIVNCGWSELYSLSAEESGRNLEAIVRKAQAAKIRVVLLTTTIAETGLSTDGRQRCDEFNDAMRKAAKNTGGLLIDLDAAMSAALTACRQRYPDYPGRIFTSEGVLLSPLGDKLVAETVLRSLGMNEAQLNAAAKSWGALYWYVGGCRLTVEEYRILAGKSIQANKNVQDYIRNLIVRDLALE